MTKKMKLLLWMKSKGAFATHEVVEWGLRNYYISADRVKRTFAEEGLIRKLSEDEKEALGIKGKDAVYKVNAEAVEEYLQPSLIGGVR